MTTITIDEALIKLRPGLHTILRANGLKLQDIDSGSQDHAGDPNYEDKCDTLFIPFDTVLTVFNDLDTDWGQLLQPTQGIMLAYIALPQECT